MVRTDAPWEQQRYLKDEAYRKMLEKYDGIAWYGQALVIPPEWKDKEVFLLFGAVDESAWVYLNGKFCGSRIFKERDDWKMPFTIRIDQAIDWSSSGQKLYVRVEDKAGLGGIWRPVMLVCREKK